MNHLQQAHMHAVQRQVVIAHRALGTDFELKRQLPEHLADIGIVIHMVDNIN